MEDFLELEEFLELEDGEKLEDLDSSREVTMEDFLELEEWLGDMDQNSKNKLDDDQHISRGDLETSPKARIDRHPLLDELPGYIVRLERIEERMHKSEVSHNANSKHLRPLICAEEAAGLHKRVKRIHDPVKIVVPCAVRGLRCRGEVSKSPEEAASIVTVQIPSIDTNTSPSIDTTSSPYLDTGRISEQKKFDVCGNLRDGDTTTRSDKSGGKKRRNWKKRKMIKGDSQLSFFPLFSDGVRKPRVRSRCFSQQFAKLQALLIAEMIDKG
ncbi:hypothetical protein DY000_02053543 [Brassica cretica]|uniref:Uncharacterized protein n=1 Tax=Brassica cretica TaxID=69181 RepID=A0ABQ7ACA0_BRACR|nr:hypothetical protein DY000_02053543 [Brassica cretica]